MDDDQPHGSRPRQVGGSTAFRTAHAIAAAPAGPPFDQAYALARLALDYGGGPVPFTGKHAVFRKPIARALNEAGLVEIQGDSDFTQHFYVRLSVDGRLGELLDERYVGAHVRPVSARENVRWAAEITQQGIDLVAAHLTEA